MIDVPEDTLPAFPMGDRFAHFTVGGLAPFYNKYTEYIYRQSSSYFIETSGFTNFILPPAEMVVAVTDSLNYHFDTARGTATLHALLSSLTTA
jgi:hypothetical protein